MSLAMGWRFLVVGEGDITELVMHDDLGGEWEWEKMQRVSDLKER